MERASRLIWGFVAFSYGFAVITLAASMWPACQ